MDKAQASDETWPQLEVTEYEATRGPYKVRVYRQPLGWFFLVMFSDDGVTGAVYRSEEMRVSAETREAAYALAQREAEKHAKHRASEWVEGAWRVTEGGALRESSSHGFTCRIEADVEQSRWSVDSEHGHTDGVSRGKSHVDAAKNCVAAAVEFWGTLAGKR